MREASAQDLIYEKISKNPKYHELVRRRQLLGWSLSAIMLVIYFGFILLVARSTSLQNRIVTLDEEVYGRTAPAGAPPANPVDQQIDLLSTALGAMRKR